MQTETSIQEQIEALKSQLTGELFADMDIKDEIHNLEMKLNGVKPMDSHIDCVGCAS
jgi:septation ring formation regulator EzrA